MIKLFRKIRKKLLTENKFSKYLLLCYYAIGEIILLVIGILIALSLNGANKRKDNYTKIITILKEIQIDLAGDIKRSSGIFDRYIRADSIQ